MSESKRDRAPLGVQDDAVGGDGRYRDSRLDDVADPQHPLPRAGHVLQDHEWRCGFGQHDPAKSPFLSDERPVRRGGAPLWCLRMAVARHEHNAESESERADLSFTSHAPLYGKTSARPAPPLGSSSDRRFFA